MVDRLPPGEACVMSDEDLYALKSFIAAIDPARTLKRHDVRSIAQQSFAMNRIVNELLTAIEKASRF